MSDVNVNDSKYAKSDWKNKDIKEHIKQKVKEANKLIEDYRLNVKIGAKNRNILMDGRIQQLQTMTSGRIDSNRGITNISGFRTKQRMLALDRQLSSFVSWGESMDLGRVDPKTGLSEKGKKSYLGFLDKWALSEKEMPPEKWREITDIFGSIQNWKDEFGYEDAVTHDSIVSAITGAVRDSELSSQEIIDVMNNMVKENKKRKRKIKTTSQVVKKLSKDLAKAVAKKKKSKK